jgi:hypothetical protein
MAIKQTVKRGRPVGAKTAERDVVLVLPAACVRCHSTERAPYDKIRERAISGRTTDGRPYTHVVWRKTRCRACGQARVERHYEHRG